MNLRFYDAAIPTLRISHSRGRREEAMPNPNARCRLAADWSLIDSHHSTIQLAPVQGPERDGAGGERIHG